MRVSRPTKIIIENMFIYCAVIVAILFFLFPIYFLISSSIKSPFDAYSYPPKWFFKPTLSNYEAVLAGRGGGLMLGSGAVFGKCMVNSVVVTLSTTFLALLVGTPAGYGLSRFIFRGKEILGGWILSTRMMPAVSVIIPFFLIMRTLGLFDTYLALIIVYVVFNLPLTIWMMRSYFNEIPKDLDEAAMVDGCSRLGAFLRVALPLSAPGLAATAILSFILTWNEFFLAMLLTGREAKTLPVMVTGFIQQTRGIVWGEMSAASTIILIPVIVFTLIVQKHLVRGLTFGAVKG